MNTQRKSALIAGTVLIIMSFLAAFSYGYAHNTLVITGTPEATFDNLQSNTTLYKTEIIGWFFILVSDVIVALALYAFFKPENPRLSLSAAIARIVYSAILGIAIYYLIQINKTPNAYNVLSFLASFENAWSFGLIIFGIHLFLLGILVSRSGFIHNLWGILLIFAAASYIAIHSSKLLFPEFESQLKTVEKILGMPMAVAEIGFAFWLIIRGGRSKSIVKMNQL